MVHFARRTFAVSVLVALLSYGCAVAPESRSEKVGRFLGTTKDIADTVAVVTPPGSGVHEIALLVAAVAGAIVSVDGLTRGGKAIAANMKAKKLPAKGPPNE